MLQDWFWSTTLTKDGREYRWLPTFSEVDDSCESVDLQAEGHGKTLQLTLALVSPDAKTGEVQEVEVVTKDSREADVVATVAVLVAGSLYQTSLSVELPQVAATLRLKRGDGPVTLVGKEFVGTSVGRGGTDWEVISALVWRGIAGSSAPGFRLRRRHRCL
ncbi:nucleoplasmin-like protein ANO39 [Pollicipes pollicipes]|uniref:nucleoplasmin-like protein ANO39 n=1 Tax=Pollicipes pollicipes TaxID=41117 RepID=UPI001884EDD7|nr:nucleoplasmin-like protein ANO39 [Pollicipes pollicipes]